MKVLKEEPGRMIVEITDETHTICNILRKRLMSQDEVKAAAYDITHPLVGQPEFEVYSDDPRESIKTASEEIKNEAADFKEALIKGFE